MTTHKIYYTDKNGQSKLHEFSGSRGDAQRWAQSFEREGGRPSEIHEKDHYTGEIKKVPTW